MKALNTKTRVVYNLISLLLILLLSLLLMYKQLVTPAYFSVMINDAHTYTSWAWQFVESMREGIAYPRWMPLDMWGYGSPTYIIYPPLSFYMVALFSLFTKSVTLAMNICIFVALFVSGAGMFFLVKEIYSEKVALLSAIFYLILPYNILQFYLMGSFASKISFMWFSLVLLFTYLYSKNRQLKHLVYSSMCYSGFILTHIINAYMFTFVLLVFIVHLSVKERQFKCMLKMLSIIPMAIFMSAAYVLPLIFEKHFINLSGFFTKGKGFYYSRFFIFPNLSKEVPDNLFWPVYYKMYVFLTVFFAILLLLFYIPHLKSRLSGNWVGGVKLYKSFLWIALVSMFLLFGPSTFLWETIPFMKYIHFPVRWLNITAFAVTLLFASFAEILMREEKSKRLFHIFLSVLIFFFVFLDVHYIRYASTFQEQELIPVRAENSSTDHQLPWVETCLLDKKSGYLKKLDIIQGEGNVEAVVWKTAERVFHAEAAQPMVLRIRTFNFPGWNTYLDDRLTKIKMEDKTGAILVDVPKGVHRIKLIFGDTPVRYYGKVISLVSIFLLLVFGPLYGPLRNINSSGKRR